MVELKNGETYNGHLVNSDFLMNIHLRDVICTSKDGERFWKIPECFIRGVNIKFVRIPPDILNQVKDDLVTKSRTKSQPGRFKAPNKKRKNK